MPEPSVKPAGAADPRPRLWHFRISHYNEKARWALDYKRWPHVRKALLPGVHVPVARWVSGQSKLPILEIGGRVVVGSERILEEVERLRPELPLFSTDPAERRRATAIQEYFDDEVAPDLRRLFWATYLDDAAACARMATEGFGTGVRVVWQTLFPLMRPGFRRNLGITAPQLRVARERMTAHFDRLAAEIGPSGYLVGDRFGVADLAAASIMTAVVRPPEFSYPSPEPRPPAFVELRAAVEDHPAFQWVLGIYARHRGECYDRG